MIDIIIRKAMSIIILRKGRKGLKSKYKITWGHPKEYVFHKWLFYFNNSEFVWYVRIFGILIQKKYFDPKYL